MIWNTYNVTLKGWATVIKAFNEKEAIILAQAKQSMRAEIMI